MKSLIMLKKNDILLTLFLLLLGCLPLSIGFHAEPALSAHITVNGATEQVLALTPETNEEFTITTPSGSNTVRIQNGAVSVCDADCPDRLCIKSAPISQPGEIIVCLPHKLLIEIRSSDK